MNTKYTQIGLIIFTLIMMIITSLQFAEYSLGNTEQTAALLMNESHSTVAVPSTPPNIVVIMTDDQDDGITMHAMNKLNEFIAEKGIRFTNSFVDNSYCCPSRASFLTGQNSKNSGVFLGRPTTFAGELYGGGYQSLKPTEENILPVWLQDSGYKTAMIGKYVNGFLVTDPVPPGWDKWIHARPKYFNYKLNNDGIIKSYGNKPEDYLTDVLTDETVSFINEQASSTQPFFIALLHSAPHVDTSGKGPVLLPIPAPRHDGVYDSAVHPRGPAFNEVDVSDKPSFMQDADNHLLSEIEIAEEELLYRKELETLLAIDDSVEAIVTALETSGQLDNTVIIFTSDNGHLHGEHRQRTSKRLVYEESIRVPLMMRGPGIDSNATRTELVNNIDMVATIVDLADATPGRTLDGVSLSSLFSKLTTPWRTGILVQGSDLAQYPRRDLLGIYQAVRTENFIYAEHTTSEGVIEKELYDLLADPYQLESVHDTGTYALVQNDLLTKLDVLRDCFGATCWITDQEPQRPGVVAGWEFDESGTLDADDSSTNNNNGSLLNMSPKPTRIAGVSGNALWFDGVNDYVSVPNSSSLSMTDGLSLSMWVYQDAPSIAGGNALSKSGAYKFGPESSGKYSFRVKTTGGNWSNQFIESNSTVSLNTWVHLAATYDAQTHVSRIYINGVLDSESDTAITGNMQPNQRDLWIGRGGVPYFEGAIDNVKIYDRALTGEEVVGHMNTAS